MTQGVQKETTTRGALWPLMLPPGDQGRADLCAVSAKGVRVRFRDGRERLDGSSGLWNCPLGFGNQRIASAIAEALLEASYLGSWGYENEYARRASDGLVELAGVDHFGRVLYSTSGGAANDMAMKLVRHHQVLVGHPERRIILGLRDGYHGLTFGAAALTTGSLGDRMYGVDRRLVGHLPANDLAELARALDAAKGRVAAMFVEPVLGTGAVPLVDEYIVGLLALRARYGFLLVADEISTGFCRIGNAVYESTCWPEPPDVIITSKGLTNGTLAASALIVSTAVAEVFSVAPAILGHAETQAGTAVSCAAILATIDEMRRLDALACAAHLSRRLDDALPDLVARVPSVEGTTGKGCLRSIRLVGGDGHQYPPERISSVVQSIRSAGALVHPGPSCVQLVPALVYTDDQLDELLARVEVGLRAYSQARTGS